MRQGIRAGATVAALTALVAVLAVGAGGTTGPGESVPRGRYFGGAGGAAVVRAAAIDWRGGRLATATGEQVTVFVSASYPPEQVSEQAWAEFFAALPHGAELALATIRIAPPAEVQQLCGADVQGCYAGDELVVPGEPADGVTAEEVARHEYGHHVAAHRSNPPWRAADWGPKRWATAEDVCRRVAARTAFPAGTGDYRLDPGEAFAEAYRAFVETGAGSAFTWDLVDGSFFPDAATLAAVERDVAKPWTAPVRTTVARRFVAGGARRALVPVAVPLDGALDVELSLPAGRLDGLELVDPKTQKVIARGLWSSARTRRLGHAVCGLRRLVLRVTRNGPPGRFRLAISRP